MNRSENRLLPALIPGEGPRRDDRPHPTSVGAARLDAAYAAQLYGQPQHKRGLRGGAPVLEAARHAYLEAEYSGENDRRPSSGLVMKTAI
jgi:hypothetical protein